VSFGCGWRRGLKQKPTTVASRGFLLNFHFQQEPTASPTTTTVTMTTCCVFFKIAQLLYKIGTRQSSFVSISIKQLKNLVPPFVPISVTRCHFSGHRDFAANVLPSLSARGTPHAEFFEEYRDVPEVYYLYEFLFSTIR
jgi:hypothetical protein